jgi:alpha-tubulin suppressor-like RCC1 family protein
LPNGLKDVIAISAGIGYSLALTRDGVVYAWGRSNFGQANVPSGIAKAGAISAGYVNSVIGLRDSSVIAFGDSSLGALVSRTPTVTAVTP